MLLVTSGGRGCYESEGASAEGLILSGAIMRSMNFNAADSCLVCDCDIYRWWGGATEWENLSINLAAPEKVGVEPKFQGSVSRGHESPHQISQSSAHDAALAALRAAKRVGGKSENSLRPPGVATRPLLRSPQKLLSGGTISSAVMGTFPQLRGSCLMSSRT